MGELRELTTDEEWDAAVPILRQLWSHREAAFVRSWREDDEYRLFGWYVDRSDDSAGAGTAAAAADTGPVTDAELVVVAGISIQRILHHERHLWVHEFVVDEAHRGEGHGAALFERLEDWARDRDCEYLALGCDAANDDAFEFYESQGLEEWGAVLEVEL